MIRVDEVEDMVGVSFGVLCTIVSVEFVLAQGTGTVIAQELLASKLRSLLSAAS